MNTNRPVRAVIGHLIRASAIAGFVAAIGLAGYTFLDPHPGVAAFQVIAGLAALGVAYLVVVRPLLELGSRFLALTGQEALAADQRPPVVYLRSYASERKVSLSERALAKLLENVGPLLAIGRPDETVPSLGAARLYVPADEWKQTITMLLERARLVVIVAGETPGLVWEMQECRRIVPPAKLIVVVPNDRKQLTGFAKVLGTVAEGPIDRCFVERIPWKTYLWRPFNWRLFLADAGLIAFPASDPVILSMSLASMNLNGLISFDDAWKVRFHPVQLTLEEFRSGQDAAYGGPLTSWQERMARALARAMRQEPGPVNSAIQDGSAVPSDGLVRPSDPKDVRIAMGAFRPFLALRLAFRLLIVLFLIAFYVTWAWDALFG
jgi:hypothetical protein